MSICHLLNTMIRMHLDQTQNNIIVCAKTSRRRNGYEAVFPPGYTGQKGTTNRLWPNPLFCTHCPCHFITINCLIASYNLINHIPHLMYIAHLPNVCCTSTVVDHVFQNKEPKLVHSKPKDTSFCSKFSSIDHFAIRIDSITFINLVS